MHKSPAKKKKRSLISEKLSALGSAFTRRFERSLTASVAGLIRRSFLKLSTRAVGVFFLTFGVYSFLISLLFLLFTQRDVPLSHLFVNGAIALCSVPLLFSKGNVSTSLTASTTGKIICNYLNVRKEALYETSVYGHPGIAFIAGVAVSGLTVFLSTEIILFAIMLAVIVAMIFSVPEAGLTFSTALLFIADVRMQYLIIGVTSLSFVFKLIRKKRQLLFRRTDLVFSVFLLSTVGALLFSFDGTARAEYVRFALLLLPYYLSVLLLRDTRKITRLLCAAILFAGALSAVYIIGFSVSALGPVLGAADGRYLLDMVRAFPVYESGFYAIAFSALIPVATAFIIRQTDDGYRYTVILSLISMVICLVLCERLACLLAASVVTVVLLLIIGSRKVYLTLCAALLALLALTFAGSFGESLFKYIHGSITEAYAQAEGLNTLSFSPLFSENLIGGSGFVDNASASNSFYLSLTQRVGVIGVAIFAVLFLFIFAQSFLVIIRSRRSDTLSGGIGYLAVAKNRKSTKVEMLAILSSLSVILMIALFTDLYANDLSYMLLFFVCGLCCAYARSANLEYLKTSISAEPECGGDKAHAVIKGGFAKEVS